MVLWRKLLWNSLSIECFPSTYDLNDFKCRFFLNRFPVSFNLFGASLSCNSVPRSDSSSLHGLNLNLKKVCA